MMRSMRRQEMVCRNVLDSKGVGVFAKYRETYHDVKLCQTILFTSHLHDFARTHPQLTMTPWARTTSMT